MPSFSLLQQANPGSKLRYILAAINQSRLVLFIKWGSHRGCRNGLLQSWSIDRAIVQYSRTHQRESAFNIKHRKQSETTKQSFQAAS